MSSFAQDNRQPNDKFDVEDEFKIENFSCDNYEYVSQIKNEDIEVSII
jgi:hypothetical protein